MGRSNLQKNQITELDNHASSFRKTKNPSPRVWVPESSHHASHRTPCLSLLESLYPPSFATKLLKVVMGGLLVVVMAAAPRWLLLLLLLLTGHAVSGDSHEVAYELQRVVDELAFLGADEEVQRQATLRQGAVGVPAQLEANVALAHDVLEVPVVHAREFPPELLQRTHRKKKENHRDFKK